MPFITEEQLTMLEAIALADADVTSDSEKLLPETWKDLFHAMVKDKTTIVPLFTLDFALRLTTSLNQIDLKVMIASSDENLRSRNELFLKSILAMIEEHEDLKQEMNKLRAKISPEEDATPIEQYTAVDNNSDSDDDDEPELPADKKLIEELLLFKGNAEEKEQGLNLLNSLFNKGDTNFDIYGLELLTIIAPNNVKRIYEFFCANLVDYPLNQKKAQLIKVLNTALYDALTKTAKPEYYKNAMDFLATHAAQYAEKEILQFFEEYCESNSRKINFYFTIKFKEELANKSQVVERNPKRIRLTMSIDIPDQTSTTNSNLTLWPAVLPKPKTIQAKSVEEQQIDEWLKIPNEQRETFLPNEVNKIFLRYEQEQKKIKKTIDEIKTELRNTSRPKKKLHENSPLDDYIAECNEDDDEQGYHYLLSRWKELLEYFKTKNANTNEWKKNTNG